MENNQGGSSMQALMAENARLKAELDRLLMRGTVMLGSGDSLGRTMVGVEEMVLQVGADDRVTYINRHMVRLLGITDRRKARGLPLDGLDSGPLGERFLVSLASAARSSNNSCVKELECQGLSPDRLPSSPGSRPMGPAVLRFVASPVKGGHVNVVGQDITHLRWLENTFARYVPNSVIQEMLARPTEDFTRADRRMITVLFADLRGFTSLSRNLDPAKVQDMLSSYLSNMVGCVTRFDGTVDKFVGDEIMVLFGAPLAQGDHSLRGLACASGMRTAHAHWRRERSARNLPSAPVGIGVSSGTVVVGNIGTPERMDYTAVGHTVNLASRLCGSAGAGEVLLDVATYEMARGQVKFWKGPGQLPRLSFERAGPITIKGLSEPVEAIRLR